MRHSIEINTSKHSEFVDITAKVANAVKKSGVSEGICHIFVPHTTSGLAINENADPSVRNDILNTLDILIPRSGDYAHSEGNSDAHIKSSLLGGEKSIFIKNGGLDLGTWQGIFFCEFDGPRRRQVWLNIQGE